VDPWAIIRAAVDRVTATGEVLGGDERLAPTQSIRLLTTEAARVDAGRWSCGRIVAGSPADLSVLDRDIETIDDLLGVTDSPVRLTMLGGEIVWQSAGSAHGCEGATAVGREGG
jgi:predicted amidohydrolase YtcJ